MMLKLLVIGDPHGVQPSLPNGFDAILTTGDFCSDGPKQLMFAAMTQRLANGTKTRWWDIIGR